MCCNYEYTLKKFLSSVSLQCSLRAFKHKKVSFINHSEPEFQEQIRVIEELPFIEDSDYVPPRGQNGPDF